jgi:hypothetical protein
MPALADGGVAALPGSEGRGAYRATQRGIGRRAYEARGLGGPAPPHGRCERRTGDGTTADSRSPRSAHKLRLGARRRGAKSEDQPSQSAAKRAVRTPKRTAPARACRRRRVRALLRSAQSTPPSGHARWSVVESAAGGRWRTISISGSELCQIPGSGLSDPSVSIHFPSSARHRHSSRIWRCFPCSTRLHGRSRVRS